jgi:hypothetical protein
MSEIVLPSRAAKKYSEQLKTFQTVLTEMIKLPMNTLFIHSSLERSVVIKTSMNTLDTLSRV